MSGRIDGESEQRRLRKLALQEQLRLLEEEEQSQSQYRSSHNNGYSSTNYASSSHNNYVPSHQSAGYGSSVDSLLRPSSYDSRNPRLPSPSAPWQPVYPPSTSSSQSRHSTATNSPNTLIRQHTSSGRPRPVPSESQVHDYLVTHMNQPDGLYAGWNIQGHRLDVYRLFTMVVQVGGSSQVTAQEGWPVIAAALEFPLRHTSPVPRSSTAVGKDLRDFFGRLLGGLEILWERTKAIEDTPEQSHQTQSSYVYDLSPHGTHPIVQSRSPQLHQPQPTWVHQHSLPTLPTPVSSKFPPASNSKTHDNANVRSHAASSSSRNSTYPPPPPEPLASSSNPPPMSSQYPPLAAYTRGAAQLTSQSVRGTMSSPAELTGTIEPTRRSKATKSIPPKPSSFKTQTTSSATPNPPVRASQSQKGTNLNPTTLRETPPEASSSQLPTRIASNPLAATASTSAARTTNSALQNTGYVPPSVFSFDELVTSNILPIPPFGTSISLPPFPSAKLEYAWRAHELRSSIRKMSAGETHRHISPDEILWWNKLVLLLQKNAGVVIPKPPVDATSSSSNLPLPPPSTAPVAGATRPTAAVVDTGISTSLIFRPTENETFSQQVLVDASQASVTEIPSAMKRGRPQKSSTVPVDATANGDPPVKKKLGRPPKNRESVDGVNDSVSLATRSEALSASTPNGNPPVKKKLGRPPKNRPSVDGVTASAPPTPGSEPPSTSIANDSVETEPNGTDPAPKPRKERKDKGGTHRKRFNAEIQELVNSLPSLAVAAAQVSNIERADIAATSPTPAADFLRMVYARHDGLTGSAAEPPELFPLVHNQEPTPPPGPSRHAARPIPPAASASRASVPGRVGGFNVPGAASAAAHARWRSQGRTASPQTTPISARPAGASSLPVSQSSASPRKILHLGGKKTSTANISLRDARTPTKIFVPKPSPKKQPRISKPSSVTTNGLTPAGSSQPTNSTTKGRFAALADSEEPSTLAEALSGLNNPVIETEDVFPDIFQLSELTGPTPFTQPLPEPSPPPESLGPIDFELPDFDIGDLPLPMDIDQMSKPSSAKQVKGKGKALTNGTNPSSARVNGTSANIPSKSTSSKGKRLSVYISPPPSRSTRPAQAPTADHSPRTSRPGHQSSPQPDSSRKTVHLRHTPRISSPLAPPGRASRVENSTQMGRRTGGRISTPHATRAISKPPVSALRSRQSVSSERPAGSRPLIGTKRLRTPSMSIVDKPPTKQPKISTPTRAKQRPVFQSPSIVPIPTLKRVPVVEILSSPVKRRKVVQGPVDRAVVSIPMTRRRRKILIRRGHYDVFRDDDSDSEINTARRARAFLRPLKPLPRGSIARSARPRAPEAIPLRFLTRPGPELDDAFKLSLDEKYFTKRATEHACGWKGCDAILASEAHLAKHVEYREHIRQASFKAGVYGTDTLWRCYWRGCEGPCFEGGAELAQHITARHISRTLACPYIDCDLTSPNISHLTRHVTKTHDTPDDEPRPLADLSEHLPPPYPIPDQVIPEIARTDELTTASVPGSVHANKFRQHTVIGKVASLCFAGPDPQIHIEHPPHMLEVESASSDLGVQVEEEKLYDAEEVHELNQEAILRGRKRKWEPVVWIPTKRVRRNRKIVSINDQSTTLFEANDAVLPDQSAPVATTRSFVYPDSLFSLYPPRVRTRVNDLTGTGNLGYPHSIYHIYPGARPSLIDGERQEVQKIDLSGVDDNDAKDEDPAQDDNHLGFGDDIMDNEDDSEDEDAAEIADFFATTSPGAPTPWHEPIEPLDFDDDDETRDGRDPRHAVEEDKGESALFGDIASESDVPTADINGNADEGVNGEVAAEAEVSLDGPSVAEESNKGVESHDSPSPVGLDGSDADLAKDDVAPAGDFERLDLPSELEV